LSPSEVVGLQHGLKQALAVGDWIHRWLREQDAALSSGICIQAQDMLKCVIPDMLHLLPALHKPIADGIADIKFMPSRCAFISYDDLR